MKDYNKEYPIEKMCRVFKVSRAAYYRSRNYIPSKRDNENRALLFEIRRIHQQSKASYGSPRITKELNERGFKVSKPRVAGLMKQNGIKAVHRKKYIATTDSNHKYPIVENRLNRDFNADEKAKAWVSDITYVKTVKGWLYLTVIIDLFDRKVVGWALSSGLKADQTTIPAWRMAIKNRTPKKNMIFHSDRGVQYACHSFANIIESYKVKRSMSRKGNCWDNAVAESFFKSIKVELIYRTRFKDKESAALEIFSWIETWYNRNRRHSALGGLTIHEFEKLNQMKNVA